MKKLGLFLTLSVASVGAFAHEHGTIKIYDGRMSNQILTVGRVKPLILKDGKPTLFFAPEKAKILNKNLENIRDFFYEKYGRVSWDNKGSAIVAYINSGRYDFLDLFGIKANAYWSGSENCFHFGDGDPAVLDDMEKALDVVAHEYTHAVIQTSSDLEYKGQSGALNEHLADVFGVLINQHYNNPKDPFIIGSSILRGKLKEKYDALRNLRIPSLSLGGQPAHMNELKTEKYKKFDESCVASAANDACGVHVLSGIPNRLSVIVMESIPWEDSETLFFNVMTKRLSKKSNFADYAEALQEECKSINVQTCIAVEAGIRAVGIKSKKNLARLF